MEKEQLVFPGDFLTVEEEYSSGKNTFEDSGGKIYSAKTGITQYNQKERSVSILEKNRKILTVDVGTIVYGRVMFVKESVVVIAILKTEKEGVERIPFLSSAQLLVSNVSHDYVDSLKDEFKIGDLIKAKVIKITKYSIELSTKFSELGVIKAFCSKCRKPLGLYGQELKCNSCGSVETRKVSSDYSVK